MRSGEDGTDLALDVEVDAGGDAVFGDFLAVQPHLQFGDSRPLHPAHALGGLGNRILGGTGEAVLRNPYNLDDLLSHDMPPLNCGTLAPAADKRAMNPCDSRPVNPARVFGLFESSSHR